MDIDFYHEPIGQDQHGKDVFLKDIWPSQADIAQHIHDFVTSEMFSKEYASVFDGDAEWKSLPVPEGELYAWPTSTYVKLPPYFDGMTKAVPKIREIQGAHCLALLGDSVTTDHISPAGSISKTSPAAAYLLEHGVKVEDFNSYGSRRGNHEVMVRGTFANVRLRNQLVEKEGGFTRHFPEGTEMSIFDAAVRYEKAGVPLIVIAGQEYGSGSSRDWAAKGPKLLGVRAVIAQSYERIHRSNLIGMGILPLQFKSGEGARELELKGNETFDIQGLNNGEATEVTVVANGPDGSQKTFKADVRLNTPLERSYYEHGGILLYVLRKQL
jgi:aconitate hydratase